MDCDDDGVLSSNLANLALSLFSFSHGSYFCYLKCRSIIFETHFHNQVQGKAKWTPCKDKCNWTYLSVILHSVKQEEDIFMKPRGLIVRKFKPLKLDILHSDNITNSTNQWTNYALIHVQCFIKQNMFIGAATSVFILNAKEHSSYSLHTMTQFFFHKLVFYMNIYSIT